MSYTQLTINALLRFFRRGIVVGIFQWPKRSRILKTINYLEQLFIEDGKQKYPCPVIVKNIMYIIIITV